MSLAFLLFLVSANHKTQGCSVLSSKKYAMDRSRNYNPIPDLTPVADVAWLILIFLLVNGKPIKSDRYAVDLPSTENFHCSFNNATINTIIIDANGHVWMKFAESISWAMGSSFLQNRKEDPISTAQILALGTAKAVGFAIGDIGGPMEVFQTAETDGFRDNQAIVDWVKLAKLVDAHCLFTIVGDQNAPYSVINKVFSALQSCQVNRFRLITRLETENVGG